MFFVLNKHTLHTHLQSLQDSNLCMSRPDIDRLTIVIAPDFTFRFRKFSVNFPHETMVDYDTQRQTAQSYRVFVMSVRIT